MAKVALLIGVSEYEPGLNPLPGAVKDVDAMQRVLENPELGSFSSVKVLKNPHRQQMEDAIYDLFNDREREDLVLFYFSGHGIKDESNNLFLATRATSKTLRGQLRTPTAVASSYVRERMKLGNCRSRRQIVILDCCFSGAFVGDGPKDDGSVDVSNQLGGEGRAILTSSTSTQLSYEQQEQKVSDLSVYTHFLVEGIETEAADQDNDGMVSVDELHDYARKKVQEVSAGMKPERFIDKGEGEKILLTKIPPVDSGQKYRKEVTRYINRGEISFVGRRTLDVLKSRLGLEATEAKAIEDEVLELPRIEFQEKLQQYEQIFTELLEQHETITESDRNDLQNLQQSLGLRNEDTVPIEVTVAARLKARKENLQTYEQTLFEALRQEYPLAEAARLHLQQMQQQLELSEADVAPIEARITTEVETYQQNLEQYEQALIAATQQEYPLSEIQRFSNE